MYPWPVVGVMRGGRGLRSRFFNPELCHMTGHLLFGCGWKPRYGIQITFSDAEFYNTTNMRDPYTRGFLENLYLRPMCSVCPFTSTIRTSDISIGDFWGIEKYFPELDDNRGISAILVNTPNGREIFDRSQLGLITRPSELTQVLQASLSHPSIPSSHRRDFFADLDRISFRKLQRLYILGFRPYIRNYIGRYKKWLQIAVHGSC